MKLFRTALMAASMLIAGGGAASAATTLTISGVGVESYNTVSNVPFISTAISTAILFPISAISGALPNLPHVAGLGVGDTLIVFCDDLVHDVGIGAGGYHYEVGAVTTDSNGNSLSVQQSNEMGQLADLGRALYYANPADAADLTAVQTAIWDIEYNTTSISANPYPGEDPTVASEIAGIGYHGGGYAVGLIGLDNEQSQILGATSVPEPATWAMMMLGFGGLGVAMRNNRRKQAVAATA